MRERLGSATYREKRRWNEGETSGGEINAPSFHTFLLLADWFPGVMGLPWRWQIEAAIGALASRFCSGGRQCVRSVTSDGEFVRTSFVGARLKMRNEDMMLTEREMSAFSDSIYFTFYTVSFSDESY